MRKIILGIGLLIIGVGIAVLVYFHKTNIKEKELEIFTIRTNNCYSYEKDKTFSIQLFLSNMEDILIYKEENYFQLKGDGVLFELQCNNINFQEETSLFDKQLYLYQFDFLIPYAQVDYEIETAYLEVENELYTASISIGSFSVEEINYQWLAYDDLYGEFSYENNRKDFVRLVVYFPKEYENKKVNLISGGKALNGKISLYWENEEQVEKEIIEDQVIVKAGYYCIELHNQTGYYTKNVYFIFDLAGEKYYLDNFTYDGGHLSILDNLANLTKGKITEGIQE